jgi:hypothetical protein
MLSQTTCLMHTGAREFGASSLTLGAYSPPTLSMATRTRRTQNEEEDAAALKLGSGMSNQKKRLLIIT